MHFLTVQLLRQKEKITQVKSQRLAEIIIIGTFPTLPLRRRTNSNVKNTHPHITSSKHWRRMVSDISHFLYVFCSIKYNSSKLECFSNPQPIGSLKLSTLPAFVLPQLNSFSILPMQIIYAMKETLFVNTMQFKKN